jgi:hypothetical protein
MREINDRPPALWRQISNNRVTEQRVVVELTIGDLKVRYPRLDNVTAKIKKREDVKKINDLIECGCILHNFLRKFPRDNMSVGGADIDLPNVEAAFDEAAHPRILVIRGDSPAILGSCFKGGIFLVV